MKHEASSPELDRRDRQKKGDLQYRFEEEEEKEYIQDQDQQQDLLIAGDVKNLPNMNQHSIEIHEEEERITYEALLQELSKIVSHFDFRTMLTHI